MVSSLCTGEYSTYSRLHVSGNFGSLRMKHIDRSDGPVALDTSRSLVLLALSAFIR